MVNPVVDSAFILAKVEAPITTQQNHVNKSKLPGAGPVKVDMDILMQRCEVSRKQKQKEKPEAPKKDNIKNWSWEKFESRPATSSSQGPPSNIAAAGPHTEVKFSGGFDDVHAEGSPFPAITQIVSTTLYLFFSHLGSQRISSGPQFLNEVDGSILCRSYDQDYVFLVVVCAG